MDANGWLALIGSVLFALVLRVSNVLVTWLSHALGVDPPDPIPSPVEVATNQTRTPERRKTVTPEEPTPVEPDSPDDPTPEEPA